MTKRFFYGWFIVGVSFMGLFASASVAPPVFTLFIAPLEQEFGWSRAAISGAISVAAVATVLVLPIFGRILDKYGARLVVSLSALLLVAALSGISLMSSLWAFYILFALARSLGHGVMSLSCTVSVSNWFIRRRGRVQAIINVGRSLGATTLPLLAFFAITRWDWRAGWLLIGVLILVIVLPPAAIFLRRRPEDMGLLPDGDAVRPAASPSAVGLPGEPQWTMSDAIRTPALWLITAAIFIRGLAAPGVAVHFVPYLLGRGVDPTVAVIANSLSSVALGLGGVAWGFLAEKSGTRRLFAAALAVSCAGVVMLMFANNAFLALTYSLVYGASLGGLFTLEAVVWPEYYGRRSVGAIQGFTLPFFYAGNAFGPILSGLSYDLTGSYQTAFTGFAIAYAVAAAMVLMARPPKPPQHLQVA